MVATVKCHVYFLELESLFSQLKNIVLHMKPTRYMTHLFSKGLKTRDGHLRSKTAIMGDTQDIFCLSQPQWRIYFKLSVLPDQLKLQRRWTSSTLSTGASQWATLWDSDLYGASTTWPSFNDATIFSLIARQAWSVNNTQVLNSVHNSLPNWQLFQIGQNFGVYSLNSPFMYRNSRQSPFFTQRSPF